MLMRGIVSCGHFEGPLSSHAGLPGVSDSRKSVCNAGYLGSIPGSRRSGEGNGHPLQYFCLVNPLDRGARWALVLGVEKSQTRLSD